MFAYCEEDDRWPASSVAAHRLERKQAKRYDGHWGTTVHLAGIWAMGHVPAGIRCASTAGGKHSWGERLAGRGLIRLRDEIGLSSAGVDRERMSS